MSNRDPPSELQLSDTEEKRDTSLCHIALQHQTTLQSRTPFARVLSDAGSRRARLELVQEDFIIYSTNAGVVVELHLAVSRQWLRRVGANSVIKIHAFHDSVASKYKDLGYCFGHAEDLRAAENGLRNAFLTNRLVAVGWCGWLVWLAWLVVGWVDGLVGLVV